VFETLPRHSEWKNKNTATQSCTHCAFSVALVARQKPRQFWRQLTSLCTQQPKPIEVVTLETHVLVTLEKHKDTPLLLWLRATPASVPTIDAAHTSSPSFRMTDRFDLIVFPRMFRSS
jgi:hypothetical protein